MEAPYVVSKIGYDMQDMVDLATISREILN